ncbi:hypothetical protein K501DRAFT_306757 [Backusella circina FSU 941]|nr:hypothetical protein K501DRAFT_306757 [Backusella circina FSU 941]
MSSVSQGKSGANGKVSKEVDHYHGTPPLPPPYDSCITISAPPPTYLQSSRLMYKNKPYISGFDTPVLPTTDDASDTLPVIGMLPARRRYKYYLFTWMKDKKTAYFGCILFCLLITAIILLFTMLVPAHHRAMLHNRS